MQTPLLKRMMQLVQKHSKYIGNQDSFLGKNFAVMGTSVFTLRLMVVHMQKSLYNYKKAE